jgi:hypothetical protein
MEVDDLINFIHLDCNGIARFTPEGQTTEIIIQQEPDEYVILERAEGVEEGNEKKVASVSDYIELPCQSYSAGVDFCVDPSEYECPSDSKKREKKEKKRWCHLPTGFIVDASVKLSEASVTTGRDSGNVGRDSGNVGRDSGNVGRDSGNVGRDSGYIRDFVLSGGHLYPLELCDFWN